MEVPLIQADVFTDRAFAGNPLAIIPDGSWLSTEQMQAIANEMNLSEDPSATKELPLAGHPVVGTCFVLAQKGRFPLAEGDGFGSSAAGLFDGEHELIVVGAPNAGPENKGRVYVYSGASGEIYFVIDAEETWSQLGGMFVSVVGDVNADGVADVYASDWSDNALGAQTGRIYVHSGANGERLLTLTGEGAGDGFGIGPADAGDVDEDGHDDLIVGAWQHSGAAPARGKVYLHSGKDGSLMRAYTSRVQGDTLGFDATGMGNVDGEGSIDFLVTSAWSAIGGARTGRMFILSGETP